jgi:hypothetical protein
MREKKVTQADRPSDTGEGEEDIFPCPGNSSSEKRYF